MADTILKFVNRNGIPCIQSNGVNLTTTAATFSFDPHPFVGSRFAGLIAVKIRDGFTSPTTAVPIQFTTTGVPNSTMTLQGYGNQVVSTADWAGQGIYLAFYDSDTRELHLVSGIV